MEKRPTIWGLTVSTSNDSSRRFGEAVDEDPASIIRGILNIFANGWQCKEKSRLVTLGYLNVVVLQPNVGW